MITFSLRTLVLALACFACTASVHAEWAARTVDQITVETPSDFKAPIDISKQLPAAVLELVESMSVRMAGEEADGMIVAYTTVTYKATADVTIDGAMDGAIKNAAATLGDKAAKYTMQKFQADNIEIRRAQYEDPKGQTFIRGQVIRRGQSLFQVQVIATKEKIKDADRVLDSIVLKAK